MDCLISLCARICTPLIRIKILDSKKQGVRNGSSVRVGWIIAILRGVEVFDGKFRKFRCGRILNLIRPYTPIILENHIYISSRPKNVFPVGEKSFVGLTEGLAKCKQKSAQVNEISVWLEQLRIVINRRDLIISNGILITSSRLLIAGISPDILSNSTESFLRVPKVYRKIVYWAQWTKLHCNTRYTLGRFSCSGNYARHAVCRVKL